MRLVTWCEAIKQRSVVKSVLNESIKVGETVVCVCSCTDSEASLKATHRVKMQ